MSVNKLCALNDRLLVEFSKVSNSTSYTPIFFLGAVLHCFMVVTLTIMIR